MRTQLVVLMVLAICLGAASSQATQVISRTPQQMGDDSSLVIRGTVAQLRSFWTPDRTKIFTEITVDVEEGFKGKAPSSVRILQLGGVVGNVRVTVSGALHWQEKEEVLLFLQPYQPDNYQVAGFSQGKFAIEREGSRLYVNRPALQGVELRKEASPSGAMDTGQSRVERMDLNAFLDTALGHDREGR